MIITYHGVGFVKTQVGDLVVAMNPVGKDSQEKTTRFGADLVLVSSNDSRYNGVELVSGGNKEAFIIDGPGEYEQDGMFIQGVQTEGPNNTVNTAYALTVDGIRMCHLGNMTGVLPGEAKEAIGSVDLLFVPIAEEGGLDPKAAMKAALALEPALIVPVGYNDKTGEAALKAFLKEAGADNSEIVEKLTIKKKDLEGKEGEVVVIASF